MATKIKLPSFIARRMITPPEVLAILAVIIIAVGGLVFSVQDALRLEQALNLNLVQTVILTQGIVNLQREVQLTHLEVTRLMGNLDNPPEPITRFDFIKIQVNNLATQVETPEIKFIFSGEDLALVRQIEEDTNNIEALITQLQVTPAPSERMTILKGLDTQLEVLESAVKQLIDRQSTTQRDAIVQTRDSLRASQRTALLAGAVVLLMSLALVVVVRQALSSRVHRAEEADRFKGQLLSSVSHELRTPLAAIQGYTQLLSEDAYGPLTAEQQTTLQRILINTTQLQGMVNNLLDGAQIEQGKITLHNARFTPSSLVETVHSAVGILAKNKGLKLSYEVSPETPATLVGDVLLLQQILFNLTSNALKFTEKGDVRTRIFMPDSSHWALQVTDTGIGIPVEAQARVFDAFWQVDGSATRQYRGSGLGLSIVKQLTDLMGGTINLTSQVGHGSSFIITFPNITEL